MKGIGVAKLISAIIGGAGMFILIHAVLSPVSHSGMEIYSNTSMLLAILGSLMLAGGFTYALFSKDQEADGPFIPEKVHPAAYDDVKLEAPVDLVAPGSPSVNKDAEYDLVLRLLSGDERTMFSLIVESGGMALQKELILRTNMSNAKVSRVLDRLEGMGLIKKERYGSTNRVEIRLEKGTKAT